MSCEPRPRNRVPLPDASAGAAPGLRFGVGLALGPILAAIAATGPSAGGGPAFFTDEGAYLAALADLGRIPVHEGFEDDAAWGTVRSTVPGGSHTARSVTSLGVTWGSSSPNNEITTGGGPARTGEWGFYSIPHGDYASGITDGWHGTTTVPLVAIGGWVETNTPFAGIEVFLDEDEANAVDFDGDNVLGTQYRFFGVIDPDGFTRFDFRETEGEIDDQKFIFADDFTFAFAAVACPGDVDGDELVGFPDLLALLAAWGPCSGCAEDLDADGDVGFADLLAVLSAWGPCV